SGFLRAYNQETGERVLNLEIGSSIIAAPISYMVDGVQYIALQTGWGGGGWFQPYEFSAVLKRGNQGRIMAFKLGGDEVPLPPLVSGIEPIPEPPVANTASAELIAQGQQLFSRSCSLCHANVDYGMTPDLRRMNAATHEGFKGI